MWLIYKVRQELLYKFKKLKIKTIFLFSDKKSVKYIYVFNHIPKSGGTSLLNVLKSWFILKRDYPPHDLKYITEKSLIDAFRMYKQSPLSLTKLKNYELVTGHYHVINIYDRYPELVESSKFRLITFLRHPLELKASLYNFGVKRNHEYVRGLSFYEYISKEPNFMATSLGCTQDNYKVILDSYFFIGITENYKESVIKLSKLLSKKPPHQIPFLNQAKRIDEISTLTDFQIEKFENLNRLDYLIYEYALAIFMTS